MSGEVIARRGLEVVGGSQEKLAGSGRKDPYTFKLMRCNIDSMKMLLKGVKRTEVVLNNWRRKRFRKEKKP